MIAMIRRMLKRISQRGPPEKGESVVDENGSLGDTLFTADAAKRTGPGISG